MPPPSDNLYSLQDDDDYEGFNDAESETDSFSEELTPTDGYFGRNGMPTNVMVPDPSLDYGPVEAKTLIRPPSDSPTGTGRTSRLAHHPSASELPQSPSTSELFASHPSSGGPSVLPTRCGPVSPVSSHRRGPSFSEHDPMMRNPPPAYSESPPQPVSVPVPVSSPRSSQEYNREQTYSTFPDTYLERGFLPVAEPQSMGRPVDEEPSESTPLVSRKIRYSPRRRKLKSILFGALVLAVVATTLSIIFGIKASRSRNRRPDDLEKGPDIGTGYRYCPSAYLQRKDETYEFSTERDFKIIQKSHGEITDGTPVSTEGEIRLRKVPEDSEHGTSPYITLQMGSSVEFSPKVTWSEDSQTLEVSTPRYVSDLTTEYPYHCLYVIVTAWLPEHAELTNVGFDSSTLNLALSDIKLNVTGRSKFSTAAGNIWLAVDEDAPESEEDIQLSQHPAVSSKPKLPNVAQSSESQFSSRQIVVETHSGTITGTYPLLDELLISSESGQIAVSVSPQEASKSRPAPADLEVQTDTGAIDVKLPLSSGPPPFRDYVTRVHSKTGAITGDYYLGSETSFKTTTGTIDIYALPILPTGGDGSTKMATNVFETHTLTGITYVFVLDPTFFTSVNFKDSTPPCAPINDEDPYLLIPPTRDLSSSNTDTSAPIDLTTSPSSSASSPTLASTPSSSSKPNKLNSLRSSHSSNTGRVSTRYPPVWVGSVHAKTVTGEIEISGEGFRTVKDRSGVSFKEVLKRRGVKGAGDGSTVEMNTISGMLEFEI